VARERVAGLPIALTTVAIAAGPARIVVAGSRLIRAMSVVVGTASERPAIVVVALARARLRLAPVVITIVLPGTSVATTRRVRVPLVVSRIVVTRVEIHTVLLFAYGCQTATG